MIQRGKCIERFFTSSRAHPAPLPPSYTPPALPTSPIDLTCIIHGAAVGKITTGTPTEKISKLLTPLLNGNGSNTTSANATNARYLGVKGKGRVC